MSKLRIETGGHASTTTVEVVGDDGMVEAVLCHSIVLSCSAPGMVVVHLGLDDEDDRLPLDALGEDFLGWVITDTVGAE